MQLKTILNFVEKHRSFVYGAIELVDEPDEAPYLTVEVRPRKNGRPLCSGCERPGPGYDRLEVRRFTFVPLWGIAVYLLYAMRRVDCERCGVVVEKVPWADGKHHATHSYRWFLARWAKRLSWSEVASVFRTNWDTVYRAVQMAVAWGRAHMSLEGVESIGVDEIAWKRGHKYLTVVYQIDAACTRLLWVGQHRKAKTLLRFFRWFGADRSAKLRFICSDMWKPYLKVIARKAAHAVHVLDRFHIMSNLSKAIDKVRAEEARQLKADGYEPILKGSRWCLLKRRENLTEKQEPKLADLLRYNLRAVRAYLLKEDLQGLWEYVSPYWAGRFLDRWCKRVMRSRIEPMKRVARSLRNHRELILNWFRAKGEISAGIVEGINLKAKLTTRKAFGFRSEQVVETALYHTLGNLPEPESTHRFC